MNMAEDFGLQFSPANPKTTFPKLLTNNQALTGF
jgi:hypothetical protein